MTKELLQSILDRKAFPDSAAEPILIETHISWVLLTDHFAFKIKKPIQFSFLDFSTLKLRAFFCQREVELNRRLAPNVYLGYVAIRRRGSFLFIGEEEGEIVDYAVWMKQLDRGRQMDQLLKNDEISVEMMIPLANQLAPFHLKNRLNKVQISPKSIQDDFAGIQEVFPFVNEEWGTSTCQQLKEAIAVSKHFLHDHQDRIAERIKAGYIVDGHGDLHSANIFLLDQPVIFDCIEFDDHLRQLDILNELAFLCMDLDIFNQSDLGEAFISAYLNLFPCMPKTSDYRLFHYYKWYRANIRLKINCLHAMNSRSEKERSLRVEKANNYLKLFQKYMESILSVSP